MHELDRIYEIYKLKQVYRQTQINNRKESTAEHIYSSIILAQYFLKKIDQKLDENKVIKLILYHDLCEIYAGDVYTLKRTKKTDEDEQKAVNKLITTLPKEISNDLKIYWDEYLKQETLEAKFSKAIDVFDPIINEMHNETLWKKFCFTEKLLREMKEPYIKEFPKLIEFFEDLIIEFKKRKIIQK
jgi:putative hydrolases of HD superfamily